MKWLDLEQASTQGGLPFPPFKPDLERKTLVLSGKLPFGALAVALYVSGCRSNATESSWV